MNATIENQTQIKPSTAELLNNLAAKHGSITPKIVLDEAKKKTSPLHSMFDWDDTVAARKWRLEQAAMIIRRVKVTYATADDRAVRIRAFVNVTNNPSEDGDSHTGVYVPVETALTVSSYRDQLMKHCKQDVETFRRKYSSLTEVGAILSAMEQFEKGGGR